MRDLDLPPDLLAEADQEHAQATESLDALLHLVTRVAPDQDPAVRWAAVASFLHDSAITIADEVADGDLAPAFQHMVSVTAAACLRLNHHGDHGTNHGTST